MSKLGKKLILSAKQGAAMAAAISELDAGGGRVYHGTGEQVVKAILDEKK
jgi:lipoate-protein ligase B